jgi:uncharacterized coiled-coil protein SlyX
MPDPTIPDPTARIAALEAELAGRDAIIAALEDQMEERDETIADQAKEIGRSHAAHTEAVDFIKVGAGLKDPSSVDTQFVRLANTIAHQDAVIARNDRAYKKVRDELKKVREELGEAQARRGAVTIEGLTDPMDTEELEAAITTLNLTREQFATLLDVGRRTPYHWLSGETPVPSRTAMLIRFLLTLDPRQIQLIAGVYTP